MQLNTIIFSGFVRFFKFLRSFGLFGLLIFTLNSCSVKPTRVVETKIPQAQLQEIRAEVLKGTVILDTRSPLEFHANKVPGSILVEWKDFGLKLPGAEGVLLTDPSEITRRLALWGIDPEVPVIVLANSSDATFGRVAWMLKEMGVKNVKTFTYDMFRREVPGLNEAPPQNKTMWMPIGENKSELNFDEFQRMIMPFNYQFKFYTIKNRDLKSGLRVGRIKNAKIHYLDVRSAEEFQTENLKTWDPEFPLVSIFWKEFYTSQGNVNLEIKKKLDALNITTSDIVVVISNQGVRSAAVTYALLEMGYIDAKNYSGGYNYIKNSMELEKQVHAVFFEKEKKNKSSKKSKRKRRKK